MLINLDKVQKYDNPHGKQRGNRYTPDKNIETEIALKRVRPPKKRNRICNFHPLRRLQKLLCSRCCFNDALFALIEKLSHRARKRIRGLLYLPPGRGVGRGDTLMQPGGGGRMGREAGLGVNGSIREILVPGAELNWS